MIIRGEDIEEYHRNPAVSSTQAKALLSSEALFFDVIKGIAPSPESKAMGLGSAIHTALLEPQVFKDTYVIRPDGMDGRTLAGKKWNKQHLGKRVLTGDDGRTVDRILMRLHDQVEDVLAACDKEVVVRCKVGERGADVQCRFDAIHFGEAAAYDVKSTSSFDAFDRQVANLRYDFSAGWYNAVYMLEHIAPLRSWSWIVVETEAPWRVDIVEMPEECLDEATELAQSLFPTIMRVMHGNVTEHPIGRSWIKPAWHDIKKGYVNE